MGFFDRFKKEKIEAKPDIMTIPYDYSGYDIAFESGRTNPKIYEEINSLITGSSYNIADIEGYLTLTTDSSGDEFLEFYDKWLEKLIEEDYVIHQDSHLNIIGLANGFNLLLDKIGSDKKLDVETVVNRYKGQLSRYTFNGEDLKDDFVYDILEANIVADELRKIGYELISLFDGNDNCDKTVIRIEDIEKMSAIESRIK